MSDMQDTKKEGRFINVLSFSLMLDKDLSLSPAIEVSKLDTEEFVEFMDEALPEFDYTHDIANLIGYATELVEAIVQSVETYCGMPTSEQVIEEPLNKKKGTVEEVYEAIKKTRLN